MEWTASEGTILSSLARLSVMVGVSEPASFTDSFMRAHDADADLENLTEDERRLHRGLTRAELLGAEAGRKGW